ncbi:MAG: hypothetical protein ACHREM_04315 [Polyangiales bacterium]
MSTDDTFDAVRADLLAVTDVDQMVAGLRPLVGDTERRLLDPLDRPEHDAIVRMLGRLPWDQDPKSAASIALRMLTRETVADGVLDPITDDADVPWCSALRRLVDHPDLGAHFARQWFAHLHRLRWSDTPVSAVSEGVAARAASFFEVRRERHIEAARWSRTASVVCEAEHTSPRLDVLVFARACVLLRPLVERGPVPR